MPAGFGNPLINNKGGRGLICGNPLLRGFERIAGHTFEEFDELQALVSISKGNNSKSTPLSRPQKK